MEAASSVPASPHASPHPESKDQEIKSKGRKKVKQESTEADSAPPSIPETTKGKKARNVKDSDEPTKGQAKRKLAEENDEPPTMIRKVKKHKEEASDASADKMRDQKTGTRSRRRAAPTDLAEAESADEEQNSPTPELPRKRGVRRARRQ